jgi:hypothetical protein
MELCKNWAIRAWTREEVVATLQTKDPVLLGEAIVAIHMGQTETEKACKITREQNGRGWSHTTVNIGSYMASWVMAGKSLSGRWISKAVNVTIIHSGQLTRILNARAA